VDVVVELLDARIPAASANPMLREIIGDKPRVVALNKKDLADEKMTKRWLEHFRDEKLLAVALDSVTGKGMRELLSLIEKAAKYRTEKLVSKGVAARKARVMVLGIPNVGKSSLINRLAGAAKAKTADKPGVTRAKQWIRIGADVDLLDTPGILWPKFEDPEVGLRLAFTGAVNDEIYDMENVAHLLLAALRRDHPERLQERFKFKEELPETTEALMDAIGRKRGCLLKGGRIDLEKVQHILLSEFRMGKFGKISLDEPPADILNEVVDG
ncbi:ribosome biogenesis GTPase YlqF, partial [uncultured Selenomonas sp.]|uniref:ribosome biogenesis GTPase YlqF n=1 Tax=uncultured Selenomonas sp. TaxID=159275 RepID=UPI0028DCFD6C